LGLGATGAVFRDTPPPRSISFLPLQ